MWTLTGELSHYALRDVLLRPLQDVSEITYAPAEHLLKFAFQMTPPPMFLRR